MWGRQRLQTGSRCRYSTDANRSLTIPELVSKLPVTTTRIPTSQAQPRGLIQPTHGGKGRCSFSVMDGRQTNGRMSRRMGEQEGGSIGWIGG